MAKIAFIGDTAAIDVFRAFGADVFPADTPEAARAVLAGLKEGAYGVLFVTEDVVDAETARHTFPAGRPTVIPGLRRRTGAGYALMEDLIRKATGIREERTDE